MKGVKQTAQKAGVVSRIEVAKVLAKWLEHGTFPDRILDRDLADHAFVTDIVLGTVRRFRSLTWALESYVKKYPTPEIRALLLCGAYQILFMGDVPDHAALHATVEAARRFDGQLTGFVNAVLRNVLRNREGIVRQLHLRPLGIRESHPDIIVRIWERDFGPEKAAEMCEADNLAPQLAICALPFTDTGKAESLAARIAEAGHAARVHPLEPAAVLVGHGVRPDALPGYDTCDFVVQDPSTLASLRLLAPAQGETILDACAAPGGKTLQIAACVGPNGHVIAADIAQDRLKRLRENVSRAGFGDRVETIAADATKPFELKTTPDAILLDVPCSNTGVFRRRADARWRFDVRKAFLALVRTQLAILGNAASLLPKRIVYSTCSIMREEDEGLVTTFLASNKSYRLERMEKILPDASPRDGSFAALLVRN